MTKFWKSFRVSPLAAALAMLGAVVATPAHAQFTAIPNPDASYTGSTTKINITDPDFTNLSSITDGTLTVSFSDALNVRTVGADWATWGSPPATESSTPRLLYSSSTTLALLFSQPVATFGFEAEPDPFGVHTITADFVNGASTVGTISQGVDGFAGARLFAANDPLEFTSVEISSDADFAIGQLRYSLADVPADVPAHAPEPGSLALLATGGLPLLGLVRRRKRPTL